MRADAEESVPRILRAIDERVETADLELELRRAHVLKAPLEARCRRCSSGRQPELRQHHRHGGAGDRHCGFGECACGQTTKAQLRGARGARAVDGEAQQLFVEPARAFTAGHGDANRGFDHVARCGRSRYRPRRLPQFNQAAIGIANEQRAAARRCERNPAERHDERAAGLQSGGDGVEIADREDDRGGARVPRVGRPIAARNVEELRQLEPERSVRRPHEHRAESRAVRVREIPDERIGPCLRRGADRLGWCGGRRATSKRRSREIDAEHVVVEGERPLGITGAVNPVV